MVRKGLGRGLSTLLGDKQNAAADRRANDEAAKTAPARGLVLVHPESIEANPLQPRLEMDEESLDELASSIRTHGLLEPIILRTHPTLPDQYQLIAGERRLRACQRAGLTQIPAVLREATETQLLELAVIENVQREDLNPIEEARAYQLLLEGGPHNKPLTQQEVADRVGKKRVTVANLLRLLDLPEYVQEAVRQGELSQGHAKVLLGLDVARLREAFDFVRREAASVRALEKFVKAPPSSPAPHPTSRAAGKHKQEPAPIDPNLTAVADAFVERFRAKTHLRWNKDGSGVVEIHFANHEDLERLMESVGIEL